MSCPLIVCKWHFLIFPLNVLYKSRKFETSFLLYRYAWLHFLHKGNLCSFKKNYISVSSCWRLQKTQITQESLHIWHIRFSPLCVRWFTLSLSQWPFFLSSYFFNQCGGSYSPKYRGDPISLGHWCLQQTQYGVRGKAISGEERAKLTGWGIMTVLEQ